MGNMNKLARLSSENGILKGGFTTLTITQMTKLKGGSGDSGVNYCTNNCTCKNNRIICVTM